MICIGKLANKQHISNTLTKRTKTVLNGIEMREMEQVLLCIKNPKSRETDR